MKIMCNLIQNYDFFIHVYNAKLLLTCLIFISSFAFVFVSDYILLLRKYLLKKEMQLVCIKTSLLKI